MEIDRKQLFHLQILSAAEKYSDDVALIDAETKESLTFVAFYRRCYQFAAILSAHMNPISAGGKNLGTVLVFLPNCISYPIIFCGAALLGHPICGINPELTKDELRNCAKKTDAKFIVCSQKLLETAKSAFFNSEVKILVFGKVQIHEKQHPNEKIVSLDVELLAASFDDELSTTLSARSRALTTVEDVLIAPLSSGSSGEPKCVLLTHKNFNAATDVLKKTVFDQLSDSGGRRSTLAFLPFYHVSGFWALCYCLLSGHRSVILPTFQPMLMMKSIQDFQIDVINLVPSLVTYLTKNSEQFKNFDLSCLKTILCGSAPIGRRQILDFFQKFPQIENFLVGYGMTEVVCLSHLTPLGESIDNHIGSCGKLLDGFEAMIVDPETKEQRNYANEPGELWLRSDCVMKGYLHDEEENSRSLDDSGWLRTGDVVYVDKDGWFYVVDRLKSLIKVNGMQVSPVELEQLLLSLDFVSEAAVIGIQDADAGEVPIGFIVLKPEIKMTIHDAIEKSKDFVRSQVAPYKQLRGGIIVLDKLPKTSNGKILKRQLLGLAMAEHETVL